MQAKRNYLFEDYFSPGYRSDTEAAVRGSCFFCFEKFLNLICEFFNWVFKFLNLLFNLQKDSTCANLIINMRICLRDRMHDGASARGGHPAPSQGSGNLGAQGHAIVRSRCGPGAARPAAQRPVDLDRFQARLSEPERTMPPIVPG